ncbi:hypothetical protein Ctob_004117 [Chrysochromulina tobinii]|uniref:PDZ domain-containing protein n=1 Tax=Chrysochromulina tobinii TaxID=1460289 RepID=A0A0M0JM42_9EUKA|nr:hypothetical protein Ctob_004117 [Chrysochromulina tobinii]|eukprot:KOO27333.1 hypothetical protein Ctob_004117 [Chrysochromulina sp. CCMP291]
MPVHFDLSEIGSAPVRERRPGEETHATATLLHREQDKAEEAQMKLKIMEQVHTPIKPTLFEELGQLYHSIVDHHNIVDNHSVIDASSEHGSHRRLFHDAEPQPPMHTTEDEAPASAAAQEPPPRKSKLALNMAQTSPTPPVTDDVDGQTDIETSRSITGASTYFHTTAATEAAAEAVRARIAERQRRRAASNNGHAVDNAHEASAMPEALDKALVMPAPYGEQTFVFYDCTPLGLQMSKREHKSKADTHALIIDGVLPGSQAEMLSVPLGAAVTGINGRALKADELWEMLKWLAVPDTANRPLHLTVYVEPPPRRRGFHIL